MVSLETLALAINPQDAGPDTPPKRPRKFTISYANAAKTGIINNNNTASTQATTPDPMQQEPEATTPENGGNGENQKRQVSWDVSTYDTSRSTGSSLSRSLTNSKAQNIKQDIDTQLQEIKENLEKRMAKQDEQISEIVQLISSMTQNFEKRMAHAVLEVLTKEKTKVQELTHGQVYDISHAPLADNQGNLPYGGKAQAGGPLDRLHHVEITIHQMADVLDTIAEHLVEKDPSARKLFNMDDDESETSEKIARQLEAEAEKKADPMYFAENDVPMAMIREFSGTKRRFGKQNPGLDTNMASVHNNSASPQKSPPPKRERPSKQETSANSDETVRERGET